ncbi:transposable element Tcb1 transposase [Trichonephila clavipes]|nr:transposable element Tcb1 transposase [Trichonephila clavipes]
MDALNSFYRNFQQYHITTLLAIKIATPRRRHDTDFDQSRIVVYPDYGLSYRSIAACVGRDPMTVSRIWVQDAPSRTLIQELGSLASQQVSARTIRRRLLQHGLSVRAMPALPLTLQHRQERLQCCDQRRIWAHEWRDVLFSDESKFCLQHQDNRICVWRHRDERTLAAYIPHRHTGPSPGEIVWGAIGLSVASCSH